ncbi:hypothetical protein ACN3XK_47855 [Actinomadura welshii]
MPDGLMFIVVAGTTGTVILAFYLRDVVHVCRLWMRGVRTLGVVVGNKATEADAGTRWEPIVEFEDQQGQRVACKPIVRMDKALEPGLEIPVVYMAHKPKVMLLFTRRHMLLSLLENSFLLLLASVFLGFALAALIAVADWPG